MTLAFLWSAKQDMRPFAQTEGYIASWGSRIPGRLFCTLPVANAHLDVGRKGKSKWETDIQRFPIMQGTRKAGRTATKKHPINKLRQSADGWADGRKHEWQLFGVLPYPATGMAGEGLALMGGMV